MNKEEILGEVINIISEVMEIDKKDIKEDSNLINDLGIESLDFVELLKEFEDKFKMTVSDKDIKSIVSVKDIVDYIISHE